MATLALCAAAGILQAGPITNQWTGASSNAWNDGGNWSGNVPTSTSAVVVATGSDDLVTFDTSFTVASLEVGGLTGTATLQSGPGSVTLNINGPLTINTTGNVLLNSGDAMLVAGDVSNAGEINAGDPFTLGTFTTTGTLNNQAGGYTYVGSTANVNALNNLGSVFVDSGANLNITGGAAITDVAASASYTVFGNINAIDAHLNSSDALSSLATVEGSLDLENSADNRTINSLNIADTGNLTLGQGALTVQGSLTNAGTLYAWGNLSAGTLNNQSFLEVAGTVTANTLNNTGSVNIDGALTLTGSGPGVTEVGAGSAYTVNGTFQLANGSDALGNLASVQGSLDIEDGQTRNLGSVRVGSAGTLTVGYGTINLAGDLTNAGNLNVYDTLNTTGTLNTQSGGSTYISGTATVGALSNSGSLLVDSGGALHITGGGPGITDIGAGSSVQVLGTLDMVDGQGNSTDALGHLATVEGTLDLGDNQMHKIDTLNNSGNVVIYNGTGLAVNGDLINTGGLEVDGTLNVGGTLDNQGFGEIWGGADAQTLRNAGTVQVDGTGTMMVGTGTAGLGEGYVQFTDGTLIEMISSGSSFGVINGNGLVSLDGTLDIEMAKGFVPTVGETFTILNFAPGSLSGQFAQLRNDFFNGGTEFWGITYDNVNGNVLLTAELTPTPEPFTMLLAGCGLLAIGLIARKRG